MEKSSKTYVIGVDGGGTNSTVVLADSKGGILKIIETGPSNLRNIGIEQAVQNIVKGLKKVLIKGIKISVCFIGFPAFTEGFCKKEREIKKELLKRAPFLLRTKVKLGSDQDVAFKAGTNKNDGILVIAGTGSVIRGWREKKQVHISGWGWLADEGSAFFIGQKTFQAILKDLDGRGAKTMLKSTAFSALKVKTANDFIDCIYSNNPTETIPFLSVVCDEVSKKGDRIAKAIMLEAAKELALGARVAIKELKMESLSFDLVMVGGVFKSKIVVKEFKQTVKSLAPRVNFILLKTKAFKGAVRLALKEMV